MLEIDYSQSVTMEPVDYEQDDLSSFERYVIPLIYLIGLVINLLAVVILCRKSPVLQHQVTVYLIALTICNLLVLAFFRLPQVALRLLAVSSGFKKGVCTITVFMSDVGRYCYLPVLLCLLVDRWLTVMKDSYQTTCLTRLASKICSLFTARLLTCICFAVTVLACIYIIIDAPLFYHNAFCAMKLDSKLVYQWHLIKVFVVYLLPLVLTLIACLAFSALCCAINRPAGYSVAEDGMKEEILSKKSERRLVVVVLISAVICSLIELTDFLLFEFYLLHGAFITMDVIWTVYLCVFPSVCLLLVDEYRQQLVNLFKRDRKKDENELLLHTRHS